MTRTSDVPRLRAVRLLFEPPWGVPTDIEFTEGYGRIVRLVSDELIVTLNEDGALASVVVNGRRIRQDGTVGVKRGAAVYWPAGTPNVRLILHDAPVWVQAAVVQAEQLDAAWQR